MKQSLQLRLGQHLTMTPQLQQAIRLLQLSTLELQTEVQQALESNPLLERAEESEANGSEPEGFEPEYAPANGQEAAEAAVVSETARGDDEPPAMEMADIPQDLPVDICWDDVYGGGGAGGGAGPGGGRRGRGARGGGGGGRRERLT